jgi:tetratricopeptide (TPR) repeat protein
MQKATPVRAAILAWAMLSGPGWAADFAQISTVLAAGNGPEALRLADAGLAESGLSDADRARLMADLGFAHNLEGDQDSALADFTQAINTKSLAGSEQSRLYLERGLILDNMNRLDDAIGDYGAALRLNPASASALNNRANVFRRQNRFADAQRDYLASLAADNPAPEYPLYGLGQVAESQRKPEEAKNFYTSALAANPGYSLAAERLQALGGTPAPDQPIILKPPPGFTAAPPLLHPPAAPKPATAASSPPPKPASVSRPPEQPGLRPALDKPAGEQAQLGAWRSEAEALEGWKRAVAQADGALGRFSPHVVMVDLPGRGRYYRLRVVTLDARHLCATLTALKIPCIPAPP